MPAMKSYLYSSPSAQPFTGNDDYGSPRVPAGRRPTINYNRRSTPDGQYTNENYSNIPFSPPQPLPMNTASVNMGFAEPVSMPLEQAMRMRNQGNIGRGPSSPYAAARMGGAAPMAGRMTNTADAPYASNMGTLGGYGATPTPGMAAAHSPTVNKDVYARWKDQHAALTRRLTSLKPIVGDDGKETTNPGAAAIEAQLKEIEGKMWPEANQGAPGGMADLHSIPGNEPNSRAGQPQGGMPLSSYGAAGPPVSSPMMSQAAKPAESYPGEAAHTANMAQNERMAQQQTQLDSTHQDPAYQDRLIRMYGTAGSDLNNNPLIGVKPVPETPIPPLSVPPSGMTNTPADNRAASAQAYRNQAAIARTNDAGRQQTLVQNQGQMRQNAQAQQNIDNRLNQFTGGQGQTAGNFQMNEPASPYQAPETQPAQAAAPVPQPAQAAATAQPGKLSDTQIMAYLQLAGGDPAKAKELARAHGHTVQ